MTKCPICDGTGTTKGWISEPCAYCGGSGELPDDFTEMMKLKNCKKCGGEAVFSGVFDDQPTYRFPECMECGAKADGNSVKDSWYERARKWNEQNMLTNEEWLHTLNTEEKAIWITDKINAKLRMALHDAELYPDDINENEYMENEDEWVKWLREIHDEMSEV